MYGAHKFCIPITFFSILYVTFKSLNAQETESMHDIFVTAQTIYNRIRDCYIVNNGIWSDHSAVKMKYLITSIKFKNKKIIKGIIDWSKIQYNEDSNKQFCQTLKNLVFEKTPYSNFCKHILSAAKQTAVMQKNELLNGSSLLETNLLFLSKNKTEFFTESERKFY